MNQEVKTKWLTALRSGQYKQTKGELKDDTGHCCLGILCEIYKQETGDGEWKDIENDLGEARMFFKTSKDSKAGLPPSSVRDWARLGWTNPSVIYNGKNSPLAFLNDAGITFEQIADIIEEQL